MYKSSDYLNFIKERTLINITFSKLSSKQRLYKRAKTKINNILFRISIINVEQQYRVKHWRIVWRKLQDHFR